MYYTYVLLSLRDLKFYVGYTEDLKARLKEHFDGKVESTKLRRPLVLVYYEACKNKYDAIHREKFLKSGPGRRYLYKRLKWTLQEIKK